MKKGKSYACRKKEEERPQADFYQTPRPLTWELMKLDLFDFNKKVLEPSCGKGAITNILKENFKSKNVFEGDIKKGQDFLNQRYKQKIDYVVTNPPFSLFDEFVTQAKRIAIEKIAFIAKTNFFGAEKRNRFGIWNNLKYVYIFNRQVDYRYFRKDNKLICGNLITGWFIWDMNWKKDYWFTSIIDVQKYVL